MENLENEMQDSPSSVAKKGRPKQKTISISKDEWTNLETSFELISVPNNELEPFRFVLPICINYFRGKVMVYHLDPTALPNP